MYAIKSYWSLQFSNVFNNKEMCHNSMLMYNVKYKYIYIFLFSKNRAIGYLVFNHKKLKVQSDLTFNNFEN